MRSHYWLLIALVMGAVLGLTLHQYVNDPWLVFLSSNVFQPLGQIFLRLLFMVVVPLILSALVLGVNELGAADSLGKVFRRTLVATVVFSAISVFVGVTLVNFIRPGDGVQIQATNTDQVEKIKANAGAAKPFMQAVTELVPRNPIDSAARALDGEIIALMVFALIFGVALSRIESTSGKTALVSVLEGVYNVSSKIVTMTMRLAPFAVFAIVFNTGLKLGFDVFVSLLYFAGTVVLGLLIQQVVVYSAALKLFAKRSPIEFVKTSRDVLLYAFSTASSNATLPKSLELAENGLKINPSVSRFVLTVGATANQNGTALFEGVTVLFLAQVYGIELGLYEQIQVVLMSILAGIGTAGVPGGSLPLIVILLQNVGVPAEGIGLILGVDRFLDMCRTTLNVSGDLVVAAVVDGDSRRTSHS